MNLKFVLTGIGISIAVFCQAQSSFFDLNFEMQAYPAGIIPGIRIEGVKGRNAAHLRLGYNWIRHGSLGKHDDERGQGTGLTLGYKRYLNGNQKGWFAGVKNDVWFNEIDWKNNIGQMDETTGSTKIIVVQPTAEIGYCFKLSPSVIISPNVAFGYEINVKTEGEPTGEGAILLFGFHVGKRINLDQKN